MRTDIRSMPHRGFGVSYVKTLGEHRCELRSLGLTTEIDPGRYRFDNRGRQGGGLFQYTLYGEGRFEDMGAGITHGMYPGRGFLAMFPSETRYWLPEEREWEFVYICFDGDMACHHARNLIRRGGPVFDMPMNSASVETLLALYRRLVAGDTPHEYSVSLSVYEFFMGLYAARARPVAILPEDIQRAQRLVQEGYTDPGLSVAAMAAAAGYSKHHFSRRFKAHTGLTPHAFLLRTRLRAALELLAKTETPIKQIAAATGFNDYAYFCHAFKRHTLYTPGSVRRQKERFRLSDMLTG